MAQQIYSLPRLAASVPHLCPRQDSNLYAVSGTGPSNQPVYQFQHVGRIAKSQISDLRSQWARSARAFESAASLPTRLLKQQ